MPSAFAAQTRPVGQTLLIGFQGTEAAEVAPIVRRLRPAGLILLPRNIVSFDQVAALTEGLQEVASKSGLPQLLFAVDQEGGSVARLSSGAGFTDLPSAMSVGATHDAGLARALAAVTGRELAAVGINVNFAPVADLALEPMNEVIGSRSYGADPSEVAVIVAGVVEGLRQAGVLACAKHFPGHGSTDIDSHLDLPHLKASLSELEARDLMPFRSAIAAGCAAVMTAHAVSAIDPDAPATLSRRTLTDYLRRAMGFRGLVLTDALEMQALRRTRQPSDEIGLAAIRAGADLLVFEGDERLIEATVARLERALEEGDLDPEVLDLSTERLAEARAHIGKTSESPVRDTVGSVAHARVARSVGRRGLAVSDPSSVLPLRTVPAVVASELGRSFAAAVGWAAIDGGDDARPDAVVGLADEEGLEPGVAHALAAAARRGAVAVLVVTGGWQVPRDVPADVAVILTLDLPRSWWPLVADRLMGISDD